MPLDLSELPEEVQVAFFMFGLLPDHYEGMSGTYMGKYWDGIEYYFKMYEIQEPKVVLYLMKMYEGALVAYRSEKAEQRRKAEERKSNARGKNYAHNIKS